MRLIDADAYSAEMKDRQEAAWKWRNEAIAEEDEVKLARAEGAFAAFTEAKLTMDKHIISPWHRVEEPPKDSCDCLVCWTTIHDEETGEVTGHGFWCEKGWYEDGLLGEVGFYCQRREETHPVHVEPDYWMPIEPPKEGMK